MKAALLLFLTLGLVSCVTLPESLEEVSDSRIKLEAWENVAMEGLKDTDSLLGLPIPVIDFGADPGWGKASWRQGPGGNYQLSYATGGQAGAGTSGMEAGNVFLHAAPQALEPATDALTQEWKSLRVPGLKREVRFYQAKSGADGEPSRWETEVFSYGDARGRTGWYMVSMESTDESVARAVLGRLRAR